MEKIGFTVNGAPATVDADDQTSLVEFLRTTLQLKGTRFGCGQEQCGACVVLVDDAPRASCQLEVAHLAGKQVTTVEALPQTDAGQRLIASFLKHQAGQCGFCLSGILMRSFAFARSGEPCTRERIQSELEPHLCRCGAHPRIIAAVAEACTSPSAA